MNMWWPPMDSNNWDLHAVVRGCSTFSTSSTPPPPQPQAVRDPFSSFSFNDEGLVNSADVDHISFSSFPDPGAAHNALHELEELCKPFVSPQTPKNVPPPISVAQPPPQRPVALNPRNQGKRKKNQQKKVVREVPAEGLPCDMWAWRKYGQKPIKGSPYPRGYYRCSSSKGCSARKQLERSRTDPTMLVLTYTGEHNHPVPTHRNSLAGSCRNKFTQNMSPGEDKSAEYSSPVSAMTAGGSDEVVVAGSKREEGNDEVGSTGTERIGDFNKEMGFLDSDQGFGDGDEEFINGFFSDPWLVNYSGS